MGSTINIKAAMKPRERLYVGNRLTYMQCNQSTYRCSRIIVAQRGALILIEDPIPVGKGEPAHRSASSGPAEKSAGRLLGQHLPVHCRHFCAYWVQSYTKCF